MSRHLAPTAQWTEPSTGAALATAAFLVIGSGGDWELSTTGPADGYWTDDGTGTLTPSAAATDSDASIFWLLGADFIVR